MWSLGGVYMESRWSLGELCEIYLKSTWICGGVSNTDI
jgi:hypothetical protein